MYEADQISEKHGPEAGDDAKTEGQQGELRQRQLVALLALHHACRRSLVVTILPTPVENVRPTFQPSKPTRDDGCHCGTNGLAQAPLRGYWLRIGVTA